MKKTIKLDKLVGVKSGSPQFRIIETDKVDAPCYTFYNQFDLADDLAGIGSRSSDQAEKVVRTFDNLVVLNEGDLVFSLISASGAFVSEENAGKVCTQNYIVLEPGHKIDKSYLLYIINESQDIKRQLMIGLQGSKVLKYSQKQVKDLEIRELPSIERQKIIGQVYVKQRKLSALRARVASSQEKLVLGELSKVK